jgi:creatinine amidohydrolase
MYYIYPELCNSENAVKNIKLKHPYLSHDPFVKGDTVFVPSDVAGYREATNYVGVVGDPTVSTIENGKTYHDQLVNNLITFVEYCEKEVQVTLRNQEIPL